MKFGKFQKYGKRIAMLLLVIGVTLGINERVKAENSITIQSTYEDGKDEVPYVVRNEILPQTGLPSSVSITFLVHFTDGDYYFDNATGNFSKARGSSESSDSSKSLSAPKDLKVTLIKYNQVKISFSKVKGAKCYYLYKRVGSDDFEKIKELSKTTYTAKNLEAGAKISFYVVAVNKADVEGEKSETKSVQTIGQVTVVEVQKKSKSKALIIWQKAAGAGGYQLSASSQKGKIEDKGTVKKTALSKTLKVNTKKVKYYRVRAFRKVGEKTIYGAWSDEITINSWQSGTGNSGGGPVLIKGFPDYFAIGPEGAHPNISVDYFDDYFSKAASDENKALISLSAVAAASTYAPKGETQSFLDQCGFSKISKVGSNTGKSTKEVGKNDNASYCFGIKKNVIINGEKCCIVAAVINGYTSEGYEWVSNFNLGTGQIHKGFNKAATKVYNKLYTYIKENTEGYKSENIKVWITGHSRGGAISNLVGIELCDPLSQTHTALVDKENVFVYGFATPRYIRIEKGDPLVNRKYPNIHNYIVPEDMVPELAPDKWGYRRYGDPNVLQERSKMKKMFRQMARDNYKGMTEENRIDIINAFCAFGVSAKSYYTKQYFYKPKIDLEGKVHNSAITPDQFAQQGIGLAMAKGLIKNNIPGAIKILSAFDMMEDEGAVLTKTLINNLKGIKDAHTMGTYLAWINASYGGITVHNSTIK